MLNWDRYVRYRERNDAKTSNEVKFKNYWKKNDSIITFSAIKVWAPRKSSQNAIKFYVYQ